jgi:hypothetical protein
MTLRHAKILTPHVNCLESYDVLLCSAGMFPGGILPQAFKELIRITKPGKTTFVGPVDDAN